MASHSSPRLKTFKADGAITQYSVVKYGSDRDHVAQAGANEKCRGIAMTAATAAEDAVEVALPGGGALLKISETVTGGQRLTSTSAGLGEVVDAAGEAVCARAEDGGVANDVIAVEVMDHDASGAE